MKSGALILLEDGVSFWGHSFGSDGHVFAEMVFNTSMTGYQEVLTDPSYTDQIVTMTYPLIGNYGINKDDNESKKITVSGFVVKESSSIYSNHQAVMSLSDYLKQNNIVAIEDVDTRALAKHLRTKGAMRALLASNATEKEIPALLKKVKQSPVMTGRDCVKDVTTKEPYVVSPKGESLFKVAVLDCGIKTNIINCLTSLACELHILPANTSAKDILSYNPDGIFISNGPGDPIAVNYVIETLKELLGKKPLFGICLGHQLLAIALGATTYKLKFGHRGANHPVLDTESSSVYISSQNHGFCVDAESFDSCIDITHWNLNDKTVAGFSHKELPIMGVQYHPEAAPGPHDSREVFQSFVNLMKKF